MKLTIALLSIVMILTLNSCKRKVNSEFEKKIIGEWAFVKTEDKRKPKNDYKLAPIPPPFKNSISGFIFAENNNCEYKQGYFKFIKADQREDRKVIYLGNKTKYKIENDSLKVLDLSNKSWDKQKIFSIVGDTLTFQIADSVFDKYTRVKYKINPNENYDKIIVSSSGCYGSCPISDVSIDRNGEILYIEKQYVTKKGLYISKVPKAEYKNIETSFKKADIPNLKENYESTTSDQESITVTFIKDNKIVKTISDYGAESPNELIWAYTNLRFLYQKTKLIPFKKNQLKFPMWGISFEKEQQICDLTQSESFYLLTKIFKGKAVAQNFEHKYKIEFWNDNQKREIIYTDGRFYQFPDRTIDIGYNFLTQNDLIKKFIIKDKNERY